MIRWDEDDPQGFVPLAVAIALVLIVTVSLAVWFVNEGHDTPTAVRTGPGPAAERILGPGGPALASDGGADAW